MLSFLSTLFSSSFLFSNKVIYTGMPTNTGTDTHQHTTIMMLNSKVP